jgi:hypothetical protein
MNRVLIGLLFTTINIQNLSYADTFLRDKQQDQIKKRMIELEKFRPEINMDGNTRGNIAAREKYTSEIKKTQAELIGKNVKNFICRVPLGNIYGDSGLIQCFGNKDLRKFGKMRDDEKYSLTLTKESELRVSKKIYDGDVIKFSGIIFSVFPSPFPSRMKAIVAFDLNFNNVVIESITPYK